LLEKFREIGFEFGLDFRLGIGRFGFAEFDHHLEILDLLFRFEQRFDFSSQRVRLVDEFLRLLTIVPEVFRRHQGVQFAQAFLCARDVKETSAGAQVCLSPSKSPL